MEIPPLSGRNRVGHWKQSTLEGRLCSKGGGKDIFVPSAVLEISVRTVLNELSLHGPLFLRKRGQSKEQWLGLSITWKVCCNYILGPTWRMSDSVQGGAQDWCFWSDGRLLVWDLILQKWRDGSVFTKIWVLPYCGLDSNPFQNMTSKILGEKLLVAFLKGIFFCLNISVVVLAGWHWLVLGPRIGVRSSP